MMATMSWPSKPGTSSSKLDEDAIRQCAGPEMVSTAAYLEDQRLLICGLAELGKKAHKVI